VDVSGEYLFLTGQGPDPSVSYTRGGTSGALTKIAASDGSKVFTKFFSVGGNPDLIWNECWGSAVAADGSGITVACGAGIEDCVDPPIDDEQMLADCEAGIGDDRDGAYPRSAGNWYAFVYKADLDGNLLWQRVDSHQGDDDPADMNSADFQPQSSAAEFIVEARDGSIGVITDEMDGLGMIHLAKDGEKTAIA
jgi:hypothetical protein